MSTARLRTALVVGLSLFFWVGLFLLFYEGFTFIVDHVGQAGATYHAQTVRFVFHLFFASLNVMLVFSSGIILYTGLYNSPETQFLLSLPLRAERIVLYKFQEAVFFSSWGFFLLASPIMIAYGIVAEAPWHYYLLLLPLIISFVYIPCGIGAICCLLVIHKLPNLRKIIVVGCDRGGDRGGGTADLADGEQPAIEAVRQRVVSRNAVPLPLYSAGVAAEHLAHERPVGGGADSQPRGYRAASPICRSCKACCTWRYWFPTRCFFTCLRCGRAKRWFRASYANFICRRTLRRPVRHGGFRPHFDGTAVPVSHRNCSSC